MHRSVKLMWDDYLARQSQPSQLPTDAPPAWHFCDNEADAHECAQLVLTGKKRATSPSLWSFESSGEALPHVGDLSIVTDWSGKAVCIIRTTKVQILPLNEITEVHARIEGEGDGSLDWWRKAHWDYYHHELQGTGYEPQPDMSVVFQEFERIFPSGAA
ncbi:ASCH domain-containing protein [Luteimonas sp. A501]